MFIIEWYWKHACKQSCLSLNDIEKKIVQSCLSLNDIENRLLQIIKYKLYHFFNFFRSRINLDCFSPQSKWWIKIQLWRIKKFSIVYIFSSFFFLSFFTTCLPLRMRYHPFIKMNTIVLIVFGLKNF